MSGPQTRLSALRLRVEREFRELPGLRLTPWQAARLWNLEFAECEQLLRSLVVARVLRETRDGFIAGEFCQPPKLRRASEGSTV